MWNEPKRLDNFYFIFFFAEDMHMCYRAGNDARRHRKMQIKTDFGVSFRLSCGVNSKKCFTLCKATKIKTKWWQNTDEMAILSDAFCEFVYSKKVIRDSCCFITLLSAYRETFPVNLFANFFFLPTVN